MISLTFTPFEYVLQHSIAFLTLKGKISEMTHLFKLENVLVEVVLETLVGEVDAELLKAVVLVILETKDVEHPDGQDLTETNTTHTENPQCFTLKCCLDARFGLENV